MTDRELLEAAAKAAGIEVSPSDIRYWTWNPLTDDGDALRLAVKLRINIEHVASMNRNENFVSTWPSGRGDCGFMEPVLGDYAAATRRAIVHAAAEIGKTR